MSRSRGDEALHEALRAIAGATTLLVASDFDGTLAPIVADPAHAHPLPQALEALTEAAALERTHAAVISGRSLAALAALSHAGPKVHLVGSHGAEWEPDRGPELSAEARTRLGRIHQVVQAFADRTAGARFEPKPVGAAFHYRECRPRDGADAVSALRAALADDDGIWMLAGKMVLEVAVVPLDKGEALDRVRTAVDADAVVFLGDDLTDERVFARLRAADLAVKVGTGPSCASYRIDGPPEVASLLQQLVELRRVWLGGDGRDAAP